METWVTWVYRFIKTDFTVCLRSVHLSIFKFYLNLKKNKKECVYVSITGISKVQEALRYILRAH